MGRGGGPFEIERTLSQTLGELGKTKEQGLAKLVSAARSTIILGRIGPPSTIHGLQLYARALPGRAINVGAANGRLISVVGHGWVWVGRVWVGVSGWVLLLIIRHIAPILK